MPAISMDVTIAQILLAVALFFIANWLGRHSISSGYHLMSLLEKVDEAPVFNFVFRVVTPLVYLAITAALLYAASLDRYVEHFYLVIVYYFVVRWLYSLAIGRLRILNWALQVSTALFTVACAYYLDREVLASRGTLLPDARSINSNLWVLIIVYVFVVLNGIPTKQAGAARRRRNYIMHRYRELHAEFADEVSAITRNGVEEALVYSVLIYETFNRPYVYQLIERRILFPLGYSKTLGPMQVETEVIASDIESVREGAQRLVNVFRSSFDTSTYNDRPRQEYAAILAAARSYNTRSDYAHEVYGIYHILINEFYQSAAA